MALCNSKSSTHFQIQHSLPILFLNIIRLTSIFLFLHFPLANSISFDFPDFNTNNQDIQFEGDATAANGTIQVAMNLGNTQVTGSVGRAFYSLPIHLWDNDTGNLTDFITHFSFVISATNLTAVGDGLAFFLSPMNAALPVSSGGGYLGLFESSIALNDTENQIVAVEFDTFLNSWDPSMNHVGIDVNSIQSVANLTWNTSLANNETANAWVNYDSTTTTLSVYLTYEENPVFEGNYSLSCIVDLSEVLPEWVNVGFSAATDSNAEAYRIVSWTFNSTLGGSYNSTSEGSLSTGTGWMNLPLMVGLAVSIGALSCGVGLFWFMKRRKIVLRGKSEVGLDASIDDDSFEKGTGPRRNPSNVRLSEWVWSLYGQGQLCEAVDKDLTMEYDELQAERLMLVGLWCCHPDHNLRPSIRQVINVLTFEAPLPVLPSQMPVPVYFSPSMCMPSYTSSVVTTDSDKDRTSSSSHAHTSGVIQVAKNQEDTSLMQSVRRATYPLAFFLCPFNATIPTNSSGGALGLFEYSAALTYTDNQIEAVEFDTFQNNWDPSADHVGIDVNSIDSVATVTWNTSIKIGQTANAWVNYNSTTTTLSAYLTYEENQGLAHQFNLRGLALNGYTPQDIPNSGGYGCAYWCLQLWVGLYRFWKWKKTIVRGKKDTGLDASIDDDSFEKGTGASRFTSGSNVWFIETSSLSNIMLDSNYNAKLGDFGLARLVDHELGLDTTVMAGTMGYMAPEYVTTGKASKKSDVYSFGVVALEIACGRKCMEYKRDQRLLEWVWNLYGKGQLFDAVDKDLTMEYDESQVEWLMVVGLWCRHPDLHL
ncbi:hypothetical protein RHSIM_Rhsim08G0018000 [Rhododendron simsii]|uniref:Protein kinase domain-containing protein n=1 Tax=Rhododendron simsii TaxID=118357 RepID=A0A834GGH0_RHOSS|nr:hypothetical protein RHSIM_Rhsim08G0018000 [Rhododendron simsii]